MINKKPLTITLQEAIQSGRNLAHSIAIDRFGDDSPEARTITRRWNVTDAAKLVGVTPPTIRSAEEDGRLPQPDFKETPTKRGPQMRRLGYTIYQIAHMREVFGTNPGRAANDEPVVISINGHKGGSLKTSTAVHMAQRYAMLGYSVLIMDMDPQAHASLYHGYVADVNVSREDTALPFLLGERGDLSYCIRETAWPGLHIIPSCLEMQAIETEMEKRADAGQLDQEPHMMLMAGLETIADDYDIIILDGSPNLGMGTVNMVCAADVILAPTPAEMNDYLSTAQFFEALRDLLDGIDLGGFEPQLRVLITKLNPQPSSSSVWMAKAIRQAWGPLVMENAVKLTDEVGKGQLRMRTIYEQNSDERSTTSAWAKAQEIWNPVFDELMQDVIEPHWNSEQEAA